ncbi:unnamed protein product, partial [Ixodes persulcatus]
SASVDFITVCFSRLHNRLLQSASGSSAKVFRAPAKGSAMLLAPSEIHFLHDSASSYILTPDVIDDVGHQLLQQSNERVPRIQVVEKDGSWFALNDSYLRVYRELERQGRCPKIRVEVVALSKVPQNVQKGMIVGEEKSEDVSGPVRSRRVVANRQQTTKADVHGYSGSGDGGAGG